MGRETERKVMQQYQSVKTWLTTLTNSSVTRKKYLQHFAKFIDNANINPDTLVEEWKRAKYQYPENQKFVDKYSDLVQGHYSMLCNRNNCTGLSANTRISPIISFFRFHKIPIEINIQKNVYVKYHNRDLKKEEFRRILEHSHIREKAFYLFMAESGLRPRTVAQLKYKHIREDYEANRIPMCINVPAELAKDRVGHRFTFIGEDGFNALKEYLSIRGKLEDSNFIFAERRRDAKKEYLSPETFGNSFRRTVVELGLVEDAEYGKPKPLRLYCLRKYFRNNIKVDMAYREFWMGHKWGTDEHYLTRDVEKHREEYAKAYPSIRIYAPQKVTVTPEMYEQLLKNNEALRKEMEMLKERLSKESMEAIIKKSIAELKILESE